MREIKYISSIIYIANEGRHAFIAYLTLNSNHSNARCNNLA